MLLGHLHEDDNIGEGEWEHGGEGGPLDREEPVARDGAALPQFFRHLDVSLQIFQFNCGFFGMNLGGGGKLGKILIELFRHFDVIVFQL